MSVGTEQINYFTGRAEADPDNDDVRHNDSGHDEDSDYESCDSDSSDTTHAQNQQGGEARAARDSFAYASAEMMSGQTPQMRQNNTGPKGVIEDYSQHREQLIAKAQWEREQLIKHVESRALRSQYANKSGKAASSSSSSSKIDKVVRDLDELLDEEDEELLGDILNEEDERFFAQYKAKKVRELLSEIPTFGYVREVGAGEYVDALDNEHERVHVVVHLYEDSIPQCVWTNEHLTVLAQRHPFVKFVKIRRSDAGSKMDVFALPALLVYRSGDLVATFLRIHDRELKVGSDRFTAAQLEQFLVSRSILSADGKPPKSF
jgi:phosducin